jgi:D-erythro-7,8-dihydroneopterin triphosphate epimerase
MTDAPGEPPLDQIFIRDLRFRCFVGVDRKERRNRQDVVAQITLHVDLRGAGRTDAIEDTVDYRALKKAILRMAHDSSFRLVESLAERVAGLCLARDGVHCVEVVMEKPGALRFARTVGVRVVRTKE